MSTATLMTTDELLAIPENGVETALIRGELREKLMTRRNPSHSGIVMNVGYLLKKWLATQTDPRGRVLGGEAGFRIRRDPDTTVGIDVAYISAELAAATPRKARLVDGIPILAVEVLSPSDTNEEISEKTDEYLLAGVPMVWVISPFFETVWVLRPRQSPAAFTIQDELNADPELPGFRVDVCEIFE